jgi:predicted TIM-barrel fold metal-dependent hydrolase
MPLNDAHCHFFSSGFFSVLARQRGTAATPEQICHELEWEAPGHAEQLADRWVRELDANAVARAAIISSVPGDETSVAAAVARHPSRFVGYFMVDPSAADAVERTTRAVGELGLRGVCLFPAMHHVPLDHDRTMQVVRAAATHPSTVVFVHCGVLTVGVRKKLGLPSRFDLRLGDPLRVAQLALSFPSTPFVIPHFGAGLLRETMMAADICANLYVDTSSSNSWIRYTPGLTLEKVFESALAVLGARRLLFGTDSSFFPRGWQRGVFEQQKAVVSKLGLGADDDDLLFSGNFDRLFPRAA